MTERKLTFQPKPENLNIPTSPLAEKLTFSYLGRNDFEKATNFAAQVKGGDVMNALVGVAYEMNQVNIPPTIVLSRLESIHSQEKDKSMRRHIGLGLMDIHGMLGNIDELQKMQSNLTIDHSYQLRWKISPFIYLVQTMVKSGQDPSSYAEALFNLVNKEASKLQNRGDKINNNILLGRIFSEARLDPQLPFSKALKEIKEAKLDKDVLTGKFCKELADGYVLCGNFSEALRVIDLIPQDHGKDWYQSQILESVTEQQLAQGLFDEALKTGEKWNHPTFTAKVLAEKAVWQATTGDDITSVIDEALSLAKKHEGDVIYKDVYPRIGLALVKAGNLERAYEVFDTVRNGVDESDPLEKPHIGFALAKAIDEAGFDATELLMQSFSWADEIKDEWPIDGTAWGYEVGIETLAELGKFEFAHEYFDKYLNKYPEHNRWSTSMLTSKIAREETKRGLNEDGITGITKEEIIAMLLNSGSSELRSAIQYFGLNKKL